jgi:hypothetical protein
MASIFAIESPVCSTKMARIFRGDFQKNPPKTNNCRWFDEVVKANAGVPKTSAKDAKTDAELYVVILGCNYRD